MYLLGSMPALRMHNLKNCTIVTGPVTGGTFANNMQHCRLYLASYQVGSRGTSVWEFRFEGGRSGAPALPSPTCPRLQYIRLLW